MDWFNTLLSGEMSTINMAVLFVALLVGLLILFWLFRKIFSSTSSRHSKGRQPRLSVTDAAVVDDKRRLVLVRRDNVEHLVMIGGPGDIVIETNIVRAAPVETVPQRTASVTVPATQAAPPAPVATHQPAPTPSVETPSLQPGRASDDGFLASRTETAAASALAAGGAIAATAQTAGSSLSGIVRDTADSASETAGKLVENATETVSETARAVSSGVESVSQKASEVGESLSADLDDMLTSDNEAQPGQAASNPVPEVGSADGHEELKASKTEDEMQRLLDELSASKS